MTNQATPRPWNYNRARTLCNIKGPFGEQIGQIPIKDEANARLIVKCVNSHDELVEALKDSVRLIQGEYCSHDGECSKNNENCYAQKQLQALSKAQEAK